MRDNRVSIDQSTKKQLENMKTALSASKNTKVVEEALALLNWVIEQKKAGHKVAAINQQTGSIIEYVSPALSKIVR